MLGLAHLFPDVGYCQESVIDSLKDDDDGGNDYDDRKRSYFYEKDDREQVDLNLQCSGHGNDRSLPPALPRRRGHILDDGLYRPGQRHPESC